MPRVYNFIFNKLVNGKYDVLGYVAYALYKSEKIGFIESYKQVHSGTDPSDKELEPFCNESCSPENIDKYKKMAREITSAFLSTVLSEKSEEIEQDYIEGRENYIKAKLGSDAPEEKELQVRRLANDIKETEDLKKAEDESEKLFDSKMLSFISHNIKNDLQSISAVMENHKNELSDTVIEKLQLHIDSIRETLNDFDKAINDKKFSASGVMLILKKLMEDDCRKIDTNYSYKAVADSIIIGSSRSMIQVLTNLMKNAVDAVEKVSNPKIEITSEIRDGDCLFHVKDNGCGISAEHISKVFDFGFTTKSNGSGSGLCYVKNEIERNFGGNVYVNKYQEKDFTTIFTIRIPVR